MQGPFDGLLDSEAPTGSKAGFDLIYERWLERSSDHNPLILLRDGLRCLTGSIYFQVLSYQRRLLEV